MFAGAEIIGMDVSKGCMGIVAREGSRPLFAVSQSSSEVRWEKVCALRRQIAMGTYFVPAAVLAECMTLSAGNIPQA